jgi:hypothetical protein
MVERPAAVGPRRAAWRQQRREGQGAGVEGSNHVGMHTTHAQPAHACRRRGVARCSGGGDSECTVHSAQLGVRSAVAVTAAESTLAAAAAAAAATLLPMRPHPRTHLAARAPPPAPASAAGVGSPRWWPSPAAAGLTHAAAWSPAGNAASSGRRRGSRAPAWQCPAGRAK